MVIHLGEMSRKLELVSAYAKQHSISKVYFLGPKKFWFESVSLDVDHEWIDWPDIIEYGPFYRLCQEIDRSKLVVVNECLRSQNRNCLTFNCIRHFLNQTNHQIIFQYLPIIDGKADLMALIDFDTRSQWKRQPYSQELLSKATITLNERVPTFSEARATASTKDVEAYEKKKASLFDGLGLKDPHTIPRNLYLMGGKLKRTLLQPEASYVGRNNRFKLEQFSKYRDDSFPQECKVFEFCHDHINFNDFLCLSQQQQVEALTTDLKVDQWYWSKYQKWAEEVRSAYADIQQSRERAGSSAGADQLCLRLV